jgi:DNA-binding MarR family transcriptional regulator
MTLYEAAIQMTRMGLSVKQLLVLLATEDGPKRMGQLAIILGDTHAASTSILDYMTKVGWVTRERSPSDRRGVNIHITDKGREKLNQNEA